MALESEFGKLIVSLGQSSQAGRVMVLSARIEKSLEWLLQANMPRLSKHLKEKLFTGYGPLSEFAPKIDLCYALGYIDSDLHKTLTSIKHIRNVFAHADDLIHFDHELILNLSKAAPLNTSEELFLAACSQSAKEVQTALDLKFEATLTKYAVASDKRELPE